MVRITLRLDFDAERHIGHGKVRLLELIAEHHSISGAARAMDMSYRRAWLLVSELNDMFETPLVEASHGGAGGGRAVLTALGQAVVQKYRAMEAKAHRSLSAQSAAIARRLRPAGKRADPC